VTSSVVTGDYFLIDLVFPQNHRQPLDILADEPGGLATETNISFLCLPFFTDMFVISRSHRRYGLRVGGVK